MRSLLLSRFLTGLVIIVSLSIRVQAHTYYEGITDISVNTSKGRVEIVHRYTTHDIEILLSEKFDNRITTDQLNYSKYLKQYIQDNFSLMKNKNILKIEWVGIENGINETVIYQTISGLESLSGVAVKNGILTGFFPEQINRTNFDDGKLSGTLIFDINNHSQLIEKHSNKESEH